MPETISPDQLLFILAEAFGEMNDVTAFLEDDHV